MPSTVPLTREETHPTPAPPSSRAGADFRPDIQALRALAVGLVVVYHLWPSRLTGGYVGVDVFFVISGYLISAHLWREAVDTGRIRLARFWARRARRLLPSALLVLLLTAAAAIVLMPPGPALATFREVLASTFYAENWFLASQSVDYLGADAAASPSRHYWSLSVEEQFYVLLPLLLVAALWATRRTGRRRAAVLGVILGAAGASFLYSLWLTAASPAAYFSTFTRLWEFALGAVVAIAAGTMRGRAWVAALGLGMILAAAVTFDGATPFPGFHALLPVAGTALVLIGGAGTFLARWGAWSPIAHVGRTSYAIYLWHWPLIVLVPYAVGAEPTWAGKLAIGAATLVLAALSTALIEDPVRFSPRLLAGRRPRVIAAWALVGMAVVAATAALGMALAERDARQTREEAAATSLALGDCAGASALTESGGCEAPAEPAAFVPALVDLAADDGNRDDCWAGLTDPTFRTCTLGPETGAEARFLVLGDSHSNALLTAYEEIARSAGWRFDLAGHAGCYPTERTLDGAGADFERACTAWRGEALAAIESAEGYDAIIVTRKLSRGMETGEKRAEIDGLVAAWERAPEGMPVLVIPDNPHVDPDFLLCLERLGPRDADRCTVPREEALIPDAAVDAAAEVPAARVVDLTDAYCGPGSCATVTGGVVMYRPDGHHLSASFARTLAPLLEERIGAALASVDRTAEGRVDAAAGGAPRD